MDSLHKYLLTIAYDGTSYAGWQSQNNALSIQSLLEQKLMMLLRHHVLIHGSGRTDSGVHALGQTAHFETHRSIDPQDLLYRLNAVLPASIRILDLIEVPLDFHARFSALKKTYLYRIHACHIEDPFSLGQVWTIGYPLDEEIMHKACQKLEGFHDFKAFAAKNTQGTASVDSVRDLEEMKLSRLGSELQFELTAKGFLYKMVRNLVGTVVEIACGKLDLSCIDHAFETGQRELLGATAPARGLYLKKVFYTL